MIDKKTGRRRRKVGSRIFRRSKRPYSGLHKESEPWEIGAGSNDESRT
jgi:hypothetical protein